MIQEFIKDLSGHLLVHRHYKLLGSNFKCHVRCILTLHFSFIWL